MPSFLPGLVMAVLLASAGADAARRSWPKPAPRPLRLRRRENGFQELQVGPVIGEEVPGGGRFDLDPAAVADGVHRLADLVEIDAPLAQHVAGILGVEFADVALQEPDFPVDLVALIG